METMIQPQQPICDVFLKIGGSILDNGAHTVALAESLAAIPNALRIVILTGGGRIAKRIKANQRDIASDFLHCWRAATLALDVNAGLLASHSPRFSVAASIAQIVFAHESERFPVFAPGAALFSSLWFRPNWIVTTDTMGLYFAHMMGARRYVIVTDVDGVCERAPGPDVSFVPFSKIDVADLEKLPSSKLDAAFPAYFRQFPISTIVVNGRYPSRVIAAIFGRKTVGTEIEMELDVTAVVRRDGEPQQSSQEAGIRG